MKVDLDAKLTAGGWPEFALVADVPADAKKAVVLVDADDFKVDEATAKRSSCSRAIRRVTS